MQNTILRALAIATLGSAAALAQNSDFGLLLGVSVRASALVTPGRIESSVNTALQMNYAIQVHESAPGRLYLELPVLFSQRSVAGIDRAIHSSNNHTIFFTPGVRFHHTVHPRVALYGAAGGGVAWLSGQLASVGPGLFTYGTERTATGALGFGGGLDFRLSRWLSLRAEGRDFVTRAGLGGESGRNHPFFTVGVGFHF